MTRLPETTETLREQLLAAETQTPGLRAQYERKRNAMFEVQLTGVRKASYIGFTISSAVCGVAAASLALSEPRLPAAARACLLAGAAFSAAWVVYFLGVLRRGTFRHRVDAPTAAGIAFGFSLAMCALLALAGMPADRVLLAGMLTVVPSALLLVRAVVRQAEMRTEERLVELQYRIARLSERLGGDSDDDDLPSGVLR